MRVSVFGIYLIRNVSCQVLIYAVAHICINIFDAQLIKNHLVFAPLRYCLIELITSFLDLQLLKYSAK